MSVVVAVLATSAVADEPSPEPEYKAAATLVPISGAGSTWSQNALDQWRRNVNQFGMRVNYQGTGSSDGRNQFKNSTVDFAVSEIPYGLTDNNVMDSPPGRSFAYMPIVGGGIAFLYNLKIDGRRVTNLRLSGEVVTKIFTGAITNWDDAAVKADNPGLALPARAIVPVVRSDGAGPSAQFTRWMSAQHPSLWTKGQTSNFPRSGNMLALAGSLGTAGYVSQNQNEGTITYVEESYALNTGFPVAKLLNKAGYYIEPKSDNVTVALTKATVNTDLTHNLDGVYNHEDKRAYPLSSYSYMIVPTGKNGAPESPMNLDKGYTLSRFAGYFLCDGQQIAPDLGYSPLPKNVVQAGLDVIKLIPGHDPAVTDISKRKNPTFSHTSDILQTAKNPPECDQVGRSCETSTEPQLVPLKGAGSGWAALQTPGSYQGNGAAFGREEFRAGNVDYAVSEIPYGLADTGVVDAPPTRGHAYIPIRGGGVAFGYNLTIAGQRVEGLRLSGEVLTKIFTGVITRWDDPAIAADNPGLILPGIPVVPVVRTDEAPTTAFFMAWMSDQFPMLWNTYCTGNGQFPPCGFSSSYPVRGASSFQRFAGSLGVAGYVSRNEGTITYVEDSYAVSNGVSRAKVLNKAGYYVRADAVNVRTAVGGGTPGSPSWTLGSWHRTDPRAYPISYFAYAIVPGQAPGRGV